MMIRRAPDRGKSNESFTPGNGSVTPARALGGGVARSLPGEVPEDTARDRRTHPFHGMAAWRVVARHRALAGQGGSGPCRLPRRIESERRNTPRARCVTPPARDVGVGSACSKIAGPWLSALCARSGDVSTRSAPRPVGVNTRVICMEDPPSLTFRFDEGVLHAVESSPPRPEHVAPQAARRSEVAGITPAPCGLPYGGRLLHGTQLPLRGPPWVTCDPVADSVPISRSASTATNTRSARYLLVARAYRASTPTRLSW